MSKKKRRKIFNGFDMSITREIAQMQHFGQFQSYALLKDVNLWKYFQFCYRTDIKNQLFFKKE